MCLAAAGLSFPLQLCVVSVLKYVSDAHTSYHAAKAVLQHRELTVRFAGIYNAGTLTVHPIVALHGIVCLGCLFRMMPFY